MSENQTTHLEELNLCEIVDVWQVLIIVGIISLKSGQKNSFSPLWKPLLMLRFDFVESIFLTKNGNVSSYPSDSSDAS